MDMLRKYSSYNYCLNRLGIQKENHVRYNFNMVQVEVELCSGLVVSLGQPF